MVSNIAPLRAALLFSNVAHVQRVVCMAKTNTNNSALPWGKTHSAKLLHRVLGILHSGVLRRWGMVLGRWAAGLSAPDPPPRQVHKLSPSCRRFSRKQRPRRPVYLGWGCRPTGRGGGEDRQRRERMRRPRMIWPPIKRPRYDCAMRCGVGWSNGRQRQIRGPERKGSVPL